MAKQNDVETSKTIKTIIETINIGDTEENLGFNSAVISLHSKLFPTFRKIAAEYGYQGRDIKTVADTALYSSIFEISKKYDPEKGKSIESFARTFAKNKISKIRRDDALIHIPHVLQEDLARISKFIKENAVLEGEDLISAVENMLPESTRSRKYAERLIALDPDLIPRAVSGDDDDSYDNIDNHSSSDSDSFYDDSEWNPEARSLNHDWVDNTMASLMTILNDEETLFIYCSKVGVARSNDEYEYGVAREEQPTYDEITAKFREKFPNSRNNSRNWIKKQYLQAEEKVLACLNHDFTVNMDNLIAFEERQRQEKELERQRKKVRREERKAKMEEKTA